ncbi:histone-lysine N-methyltransferase SETMAR [Trichonephila clavipes]|nr:histone-lysine N-methyltransferase SETMAR [Trichonephila clavipes]
MTAVYGEYSLCHSSVVERGKRFLEGHDLLEDNTLPGQAHRVITLEMIAEVNALVLDKCRITTDEIHRLLGIILGTVYTIMHQHLNFQNFCKQWVPHQMTQRNTRSYPEEEYGFLSQIVTGDETWCHNFEPERKCYS